MVTSYYNLDLSVRLSVCLSVPHLIMKISPMKAILESLKIGKVSTQTECPRMFVLSLYITTKCVPDP